MVSAPLQTLCTTLNSVVSIASKSVYGQEWGQKHLDGAGRQTAEKRDEFYEWSRSLSKIESPIKEKTLLIEKTIYEPIYEVQKNS